MRLFGRGVPGKLVLSRASQCDNSVRCKPGMQTRGLTPHSPSPHSPPCVDVTLQLQWRHIPYPTSASRFGFIVETVVRRVRTIAPSLPRWIPVVLGRVQIVPPRRSLGLYVTLMT